MRIVIFRSAPFFIYNTVTTVMNYAIVQGRNRIRECVTQFPLSTVKTQPMPIYVIIDSYLSSWTRNVSFFKRCCNKYLLSIQWQRWVIIPKCNKYRICILGARYLQNYIVNKQQCISTYSWCDLDTCGIQSDTCAILLN